MHIVMGLEVLFSIIAITGGVTSYAFIKSKHAERMLQIKMGIPLDKTKSYFELKFGFLFIGIGIGIIAAFTLNHILSKNVFQLYPAFIFLFGGLGLLMSFFVIKKNKEG